MKSRCTDQQIAFALQQAEAGTPVPEVCRKMACLNPLSTNGSRSTAGSCPPRSRNRRHLEEENARLKRLVADLTLYKEMLSETMH
jgi:putative transposase